MTFDYQDKTWGGSRLRLAPKYLQYLKLKYTLKDLADVSGRVLDLGCGGGNIAEAISFYRPDLEVFGVDISPEAIKKAKKEARGIKFSVGDANNLPFKKNTFKAVFIFDLLEHISEPERVIAQAFRVLKPGGRMIIFAPLEGQPLTLYWLLSWFGWRGKEKHCGHIQKFSDQGLTRMIKDQGFNLLKTRFSFHCLWQILDITFDSCLAGRLKVGLEEHLKKRNIFFNLIKDLLVSLANLESQMLFWLPGGGIQLTWVKK